MPWYIVFSSEVFIGCHIGMLMTKNMKIGKCQILGSHSVVAEDSVLFRCDMAMCAGVVYDVPNGRR